MRVPQIGGQDAQHILPADPVYRHISQHWEGVTLKCLYPGNGVLVIAPARLERLMGLFSGLSKRWHFRLAFLGERIAAGSRP